ncbi:MAG: hypothetical protein ABIK28_05465 [Planctomycetota bacterium]
MRSLEGVNKPDMAVIAAAQRDAEVQLKTINAVASLFSVASKNRRMMLTLDRQGVMDETTAIDFMLGDPEIDKVKCPEHDNLITRSECLDYSGHHHEECSGCEIGVATKDKLLGDA